MSILSRGIWLWSTSVEIHTNNNSKHCPILFWKNLFPALSAKFIVRGKSSVFKWNCENFDTFMKLGMVEDNHLRIGKSMGGKFENQ